MVQIFADANRSRIRYAKESDSTWGTTPVSGVTRELRFTSSTINAQKQTTSSDEIRADRMTSDVIEISANSQGDFNVEFSAGTHDDFLEGFSYGFWTRPMTFDMVSGSSVAWTSTSALTVTGVDLTNYYTAGRRVRTTGWENNTNNDYFTISSVAYSGGNTVVTMTTTTSVVEAGSNYTKMYDANDVIVINDAHIRCGTSSASSFDSNSNNSFSAAVAAGQLVVGQKIYVEGLGYERGTATFGDHTMTAVAAGAIVTVSDGVNSVNFQFGGTVPSTSVSVSAGADETASATNLAAAINHQHVVGADNGIGPLNCTAKASAGVVTVKNLNKTGGTLSKTADTNTAISFAAFSGGNAAATGIFTLTSVANDTLGVTPAPGTINNSTVKVTIKGSMLRNPAASADIHPHSFAFETGFEDISQYFVTNGHRIAGFSYDIASNAIIKGQYTLQGKSMLRRATTLFGNTGSYTVCGPTITPVANSTINVGAITLNGSALATAVQSISVKGANNLREQMAVSNKYPAGVGSGRLDITGNLVAYFATGALWDAFDQHTFVTLSFPMTDGENHHYEWTLPKVVFDTDTANPGGGNSDIMENLSFVAKRDPATQCEFQIDRFSCILPTTTV